MEEKRKVLEEALNTLQASSSYPSGNIASNGTTSNGQDMVQENGHSAPQNQE